jgi:hypothetical protein
MSTKDDEKEETTDYTDYTDFFLFFFRVFRVFRGSFSRQPVMIAAPSPGDK